MFCLFDGVDLRYDNACTGIKGVSDGGVVMSRNAMLVSRYLMKWYITYRTSGIVLPSLMKEISWTIWTTVRSA